jgi:shikimate dehydrogenase
MRKFGLIGYPLGHSFSKKYFSEKFRREEIADCSYENYPLTNLTQFPKLISEVPDLTGLNVTIPYKSEIIRYIDITDTEASEIGAVNVLKIKRSGDSIKLYGFNSDITGIRESLSPYLSDFVKNAIVLGTGGSSLAVCHVLRKHGINVLQVSRKHKPGVIIYEDIADGLLENCELIVNTTPLGMFPDVQSRPDINYNLLSERHILFDLVYNPEMTAFLKMGKERGCQIINGIKMLWSQAERSWEIWNDDNY